MPSRTDLAGGGELISQSGSGLRVNFAAQPRERVEDAFNSLAQAGKAPKASSAEPPKWLPWVQLAGTNWKSNWQTGDIRGDQFNALAGVTYRLSDNLLIGTLGGYERFNYTSQVLSGRLKGEGWTAGGYFGWRFLPASASRPRPGAFARQF